VKITTFVNLANLEKICTSKVYDKFDKIHSDGTLLTNIINILYRKNIKRKSFDYTSVAKKVLFSPKFESILFCGGAKDEIIKFKNNAVLLRKKDAIFIDGYVDKNLLYKLIIKNKPDCIVLSMGAGLQERIALEIKNMEFNFIKNVFTSGAFITQTAVKTYYYPKLINIFNLRWFYRAIKSEHVRKRLLIDYPHNILYILKNYNKLRGLISKIS